MNDLSIHPPHPTNMYSDHHLESFEVETPSLDDIESVIDGLFLPVNRSITPTDIRKDPILSAIAKQQALVGKGPFQNREHGLNQCSRRHPRLLWVRQRSDRA
jgi:hypothetical protein